MEMSISRQGHKWTKQEDSQLREMFANHWSYGDMALKLGRTWFACKCRSIRLGLIDATFSIEGVGAHTVPNPLSPQEYRNKMLEQQTQRPKADSNTFTLTDQELSVISSYLKARLVDVMLQKLDGTTKINQDVNLYCEFLQTEILKINNLKLMSEEERKSLFFRVLDKS